MSRTAARVRRRLVRPTEPVERTRWLFFVIALLSLLVSVPAALLGGGPVQPLVLLISAAAVATSWTHRYLTRTAPFAFCVTDVLGAAAFALASPLPAVALSVVFPGMWFRALYGSTWRVGLYALTQAAGLLGVTLAWGIVPGHPATTAVAPVLGALPGLGLTLIGARYLAFDLFERERTRGRDRALRELGTNLLGVTDPRAIRAQGWLAVEQVARRTPGLQVIAVAVDDGALRVVEQTGDLGFTSLPLELIDGATGEAEEIRQPAVLDENRRWLRIPLPRFPNHTGVFPGAFMLVGAPHRIPPEAVTALQSLNNQVALAMRSSQAHRDLATQALTDTLTGLANRAAFTAALDEATVEAADRTWVLFLDLDDFKVVNDELGHSAGDGLLRHIGARMLGALREQDLCARLGGDEFGVLLREAEPDVARRISQRLVELLSAPVTLEGRRVQLGASLGLACLQPGSTGTEVVQHADLAMYAAKAAGKNRVQVFSPALLDVSGASVLEAELRAAVDGDQFVVHYQPIVCATDGRCLAVEALVRWQHPVRGLLAPAEFLDVAEHTGIGIAIGEHVLRAACAEAAGWPGIALHVNVSPLQLAHPHFVTVVREVLAEHELAPKQLIIEITESTVLDAPAVQATLDVLAALGVGIAVDDFGTGYSALTTLRTLPVDVVKIDKSFVAGAATEDADQAVIEAIAQMAHRLGLQTVAEGVERHDQQEFVRRAGITAIQGRLHHSPVPAVEFSAWLAGEHSAVA